MVSVRGDIVGSAATPAVISAFGRTVAPTKGADTAIASLAVGGRVEFARILAGYGTDGTPLNADASVGTVKVGADWIASTLLAGAGAGMDTYEGTADDEKLSGGSVRDSDSIFSSIAALTIKGQAYGTVATTRFVRRCRRANQAGETQWCEAAICPRRPYHRRYLLRRTDGPGATGEISDFAIFEVQL
jgi:hypothetical protein